MAMLIKLLFAIGVILIVVGFYLFIPVIEEPIDTRIMYA